MRVEVVGKFISEDLGIPYWQGHRLAWFLDLVNHYGLPAVGIKTRYSCAFFGIESQNNMKAVAHLRTAWYSAKKDEVFLKLDNRPPIDRPLSAVVRFPSAYFSGSKTRYAILRFKEVFYAEKANR